MSQIAPRMSRTLWPVWCRRAWWGSTVSGQNLFTPGVGRRGCVGLGRRGFDDVDGAVGWGRGWGACRHDLGPDACRRSGFPGQGRRPSGFPGQGARRQGRRWLDDMDTPMEYGLGQRWMAPSRGGMGLGGLGPWCGRQRLWRNNGSVAAGNKSVEVGLPRHARTHSRMHIHTPTKRTHERTRTGTNSHAYTAYTHTRTHAHTRAHTRTRARTHTHVSILTNLSSNANPGNVYANNNIQQ